ncbi:hypothetical protein [Nocardia seriolae]|uniref:MFS transporter n=1 Tax=Nocardia seriolae TaxID=37332 RepID=A0ABC9Z2S2_9NOCA|nr:hypothetical protein [Nocardia seriolae]APA98623.1 hypothetical protein NS506_04575 [Nocardia seriolae]OJF80623.1 hypothetical protein NS14008_17155 [Nocardia seriolae]QUN17088.1 hypothetical protein KEC46_33885 [Nocardia seriolae]WKY55792.1 hypothetical protein Q5P07_18300 [Nocardia seriolae]WNJ55787.1 hypothetical protein RMO66_19800 [Nocardia seriolae]
MDRTGGLAGDRGLRPLEPGYIPAGLRPVSAGYLSDAVGLSTGATLFALTLLALSLAAAAAVLRDRSALSPA